MENFIDSESSMKDDGPIHLELQGGLSDESDSPILNSLVRKTYFEYARKMLVDNASQAQINISNKDINKYAQEIELNALKACMSSMVYRYVMISEINHVKYMTSNNVSFTEKKLVDPEEVAQTADGLNLMLQNYVAQTQNNNHLSLVTTRNYSHKRDESKQISSPTTSEQETIEEINIPIKSEPIVNEDSNAGSSLIEELNLPLRCIEEEIKSEEIQLENSQECESTQGGNGSEEKYNKVIKELTEMFSTEEATCSSTSTEVQSTPSSVISSDRYFQHCDRKFWSLEYEINKAQFQQLSSSMYELNQPRFEHVSNKIKEIFGGDGSPVMATSPIPLKKVTQICKERITWHLKHSLSLYYKKKRFRSADEFRILAKNIVTSLIQIDPFMSYKDIYKAIHKVFAKKDVHVQNITHIQSIVSKVSNVVLNMNGRS